MAKDFYNFAKVAKSVRTAANADRTVALPRLTVVLLFFKF